MIDWNSVFRLNSWEFSENPDKYADPMLIYNLSDLRRLSNERIYPSPVSGALARFNGSETSQHYVGSKDDPVRKSTGIDIFMEGTPFSNYSFILHSRLFTGIGIYLDTTGPDGLNWIMFHLDMRPFKSNLPLIWIATKEESGSTKYHYPLNNIQNWTKLNNERFFTPKEFGY